MKCFLVYVKEWSYDTYDGVVVLADSKEEVRSMMKTERENSFCDRTITTIGNDPHPPYFYECQGEIIIEEITKKGVVLASFNAG